jgi:hypothetical protein
VYVYDNVTTQPIRISLADSGGHYISHGAENVLRVIAWESSASLLSLWFNIPAYIGHSVGATRVKHMVCDPDRKNMDVSAKQSKIIMILISMASSSVLFEQY